MAAAIVVVVDGLVAEAAAAIVNLFLVGDCDNDRRKDRTWRVDDCRVSAPPPSDAENVIVVLCSRWEDRLRRHSACAQQNTTGMCASYWSYVIVATSRRQWRVAIVVSAWCCLTGKARGCRYC